MNGADYKVIPQRCDRAHPNSCAHCGEFLAVPGSPYCPIHGGHSEIQTVRQELYEFNKTVALGRLKQFKGHPEARSLTNELALQRLLLEQVINQCKNSYDLILQEATISRLLAGIQSTLVANQKVEERANELLTIEQVVSIIQMVFEIIKEFVSTPDTQEQIARRLNELIGVELYAISEAEMPDILDSQE